MSVLSLEADVTYRDALEHAFERALAVADATDARHVLNELKVELELRLPVYLHDAVPGNGLVLLWAAETQLTLPELDAALGRDPSLMSWRDLCREAIARIRAMRDFEARSLVSR